MTKHHFLRLLSFVCLAWTSLAAAEPAKRTFDIPAQPAPAALQLFIKQAATAVVFVPEQLREVSSQPVKGEYAPAEALKLLLGGTGFSAAQGEGGTFIVSRGKAATGAVRGSLSLPNGAPAAGVPVVVRETSQSTETDKDGQFVFNAVTPGSHVLVARADGYQPLHITDVVIKAGNELSLSRETLHKPADGVTVLEPFVVHAETVEQLDKYSVTGERMKPFVDGNLDIPRTMDDAKPYYIFDAATIEQSGATTVEDFFKRKLTMMSSYASGSTQSAAAVSPYVGTASSVSLRGLAATQTLILLNGRRLPPTSGTTLDGSVDLNSIPMGIIDRIEVLPSSASGIYGGGAVGGVINVITKRNYSGGELALNYNNTFRSDTAKRRADFTYGLTLEGGRTHAMIFASKSDGNDLTVQDRYGLIRENIARVAVNNPTFFTGSNTLLGTTPRIESVGGVPLVLKSGQSLGTAVLFVPAGYRGLAADGTAGLVANAGKLDTEWPDTQQWFNGRHYPIYSVPETESIRAEIRRQMLPALEAYVNFGYDRNALDATEAYFGFVSQNGQAVPASAPTNPFNQNVVVRIPTDGGVTPFITKQARRQAAGGFSLKLPHDWLVLADFSWNSSSTLSIQPTGSSATITAALAAGTFDPFIDLLKNPASDKVATYVGLARGDAGQKLSETTVRVAGPLPKFFGRSPSLAAGAQYRTEQRENTRIINTYEFMPALNTASGFLGAGQTITSYYAELTVPLISTERTFPGVRLLEAQITGRRDEYTNSMKRVKGTSSTSFTSATVPDLDEPKVNYAANSPTFGVRYKPVESVMLRASFAKGFLPPTAFQLVPGIPATTPTAVTDPLRGGTSAAVLSTATGGNPNVTPETSDNWSAGVVFTPKFLPGLRFAVDYTWIKKANNIATLGAQVIVSNEALFPGRVTRAAVTPGDPYGVGQITGVDVSVLNLFSTSLEAYDISLGYQKTTATMGTFAFDGLATVTPHYQQRITLGAPLLEYVGTPALGGPLRLRANFNATWSYHQWQVGWTTTYYDRYKVLAAPFNAVTSIILNNGGPWVSRQTYHDMFVRYRFGGSESHQKSWRSWASRMELQVGVRNVFDKAPAFDGSSLAAFFLSPYGDARLRSYWISVKKAL